MAYEDKNSQGAQYLAWIKTLLDAGVINLEKAEKLATDGSDVSLPIIQGYLQIAEIGGKYIEYEGKKLTLNDMEVLIASGEANSWIHTQAENLKKLVWDRKNAEQQAKTSELNYDAFAQDLSEIMPLVGIGEPNQPDGTYKNPKTGKISKVITWDQAASDGSLSGRLTKLMTMPEARKSVKEIGELAETARKVANAALDAQTVANKSEQADWERQRSEAEAGKSAADLALLNAKVPYADRFAAAEIRQKEGDGVRSEHEGHISALKDAFLSTVIMPNGEINTDPATSGVNASFEQALRGVGITLNHGRRRHVPAYAIPEDTPVAYSTGRMPGQQMASLKAYPVTMDSPSIVPRQDPGTLPQTIRGDGRTPATMRTMEQIKESAGVKSKPDTGMARAPEVPV